MGAEVAWKLKSMSIRLEKYLAESGVASRRRSKSIISAGRVTVNGEVVLLPGTRVEPDVDIVELDGVRILPEEKKVYIMLNKPAGYLSTARDERNRPIVLDLLTDIPVRVYPVGRLDADTEGLLLFTNDGEFSHKLMHPRYHVDKVYLAWVEGHPNEESLEQLRNGVEIKDGLTAPAEVTLLKQAKNRTLLKIIIHEGKKRQIKRMCKRVGHEVQHLKRIQIGTLKLGNLSVGKYRHLSHQEVEGLRI